jgi:RND family efflux transporter MFP subunit
VTDSDLSQLKIDRSTSRSRRRRGWGGLIAWAVVLALAGAGLWLFRKPLLGTVDRLRLPEVQVVHVRKQSALAATAVSGTAGNGYIVASKRAALSADTPGRIVEMNVTEGSVVKKGDVVARLYADEYRAALRQTEAELEAGRVSVERARSEAEAARLDLPRLQAEVERAKVAIVEQAAALELAQQKLARADKLLAEKILDPQSVDDARAALVAVQGSHDVAKADLQVSQAAHAQGLARVESLLAGVSEAQSRLPVLQAAVDAARATLDKTEVRAPFDGIVVLKDAEVGEVVSPNSQGGNSRGSVATMVDWSSLEVQVELPETNLAAARVGDPAQIYLDAYPDRLYTGRVQRIWPTANRQKATVEVRVGFDRPDELLKPEMGARVVFSPEAPPAQAEEGGEPSIVIPLGAVVPIAGKPSVFVLERDVARVRALELGPERSGRVQVLSGLSGGERIVDTPPSSLQDGDRVRVKE